MVAEPLSENELSILVEELIDAEWKAIELAEAGAGLARVNKQFALVRGLHQRIGDMRLQLAQQT